ncbi:MAG: peptide deformylase [Solirubrobacterales bacterium]
MAVRDVHVYPAPILKQVASEATADEAEATLADLLDTMRAHERCVGIAAPQIGIPLSVAVVDVSGHPHGADSHGLIEPVNPVVSKRSQGSKVSREGRNRRRGPRLYSRT